jgi:hypothetical protein
MSDAAELGANVLERISDDNLKRMISLLEVIQYIFMCMGIKNIHRTISIASK